MEHEEYTPGYTENSVQFMSKRSIETHGEFMRPFLPSARRILDCACGPGSITCGIAKASPHASIIGIDAEDSQISLAKKHASDERLGNVEFQRANVYELPFNDGQFDLVVSHALFEHLAEPKLALQEVWRVLTPNGTAALCSPDWGGFLLAPSINEADQAIECYKQLQIDNGGDVYIGRKFGQLFESQEFRDIKLTPRFDLYDTPQLVAEYLAVQLQDAGENVHAASLRKWAETKHAMFAASWIACTGRK